MTVAELGGEHWKASCTCAHACCNTGITIKCIMKKLQENTHKHTHMLDILHQCSCCCWFGSLSLPLKPSTTHRCLFCSLKQNLRVLLAWFTMPYSRVRPLHNYGGGSFCSAQRLPVNTLSVWRLAMLKSGPRRICKPSEVSMSADHLVRLVRRSMRIHIVE